MYEADWSKADADIDRRNQLRSFLINCRSRLMPAEVGLPLTTRRRVQGLRRCEVAELIGVSLNWYSSFESGREVRVSPGFVSRLAGVLRLAPHEERTLFFLAFVEMYRVWAA
jgi:Helix-turn-helix domain